MQTNQIITGDSRDELTKLPKNSVDMCMTSPPYWGLRNYDTDDEIGRTDDLSKYVGELIEVFELLQKPLKESGVFFLNISDQYQSTAPGTQNAKSNINETTAEKQGQHYRYDSGLPAKSLMQIPERVTREMLDSGWLLRNKIVWKKKNPLPEPSAVDRFKQSWEPVYMFTLNSHYQFNEQECDNSDVWEIPTSTGGEHPAMYPVELCKRAIRGGCPENGIVLDPFSGSGTTCLAAKEMGREYIGIELNPEYADESRGRLGMSADDPERLRDNTQGGLESFTD